MPRTAAATSAESSSRALVPVRTGSALTGTAQRDAALAAIAAGLRIETLEVRGRDHLDFHELSVGQLKKALEAAFAAGLAAAGR